MSARVRRDGRPALLVYAGDLDPSGEDIDRDFLERTGCWDRVERVAVSDADVSRFDLPKSPGKPQDSRAEWFITKHGDLYQVEVEALEPGDLHNAFQVVIDAHWDQQAYDDALNEEQEGRDRLEDLADAEEE